MDNYSQIFGSKLENLMTEHGLTQLEFADQLYVTNSSLSSYIIGRRVPRIETAVDICNYFDVSLDYMFGLSSVRKPINQSVVDMPIYKTYFLKQFFRKLHHSDSSDTQL